MRAKFASAGDSNLTLINKAALVNTAAIKAPLKAAAIKVKTKTATAIKITAK